MQTTAKMARVFGMKIAALRRRTELSKSEKEADLTVRLSLTSDFPNRVKHKGSQRQQMEDKLIQRTIRTIY